MKIVFAVRHQCAGIHTEQMFEEHPTEAQLAQLDALFLARHGEKHPKTSETYWRAVVSIPLLGSADAVELPSDVSEVAAEDAPRKHARGRTASAGMQASGTVTPPRK